MPQASQGYLASNRSAHLEVGRIQLMPNALDLLCQGGGSRRNHAASILCRAPPDARTVAQQDDHPRDRPREGDAKQDREQRLHNTALEDTGVCRVLLNMPIWLRNAW